MRALMRVRLTIGAAVAGIALILSPSPARAHHAFAAALQAGRAPSPDVDDALRAHALVEAAYRSAAARRVVEMSELGS